MFVQIMFAAACIYAVAYIADRIKAHRQRKMVEKVFPTYRRPTRREREIQEYRRKRGY